VSSSSSAYNAGVVDVQNRGEASTDFLSLVCSTGWTNRLHNTKIGQNDSRNNRKKSNSRKSIIPYKKKKERMMIMMFFVDV